ncbi:hypothetical protein HYPDE_26238 [Hyphomicrobium denitrificans 1NES1]|uniref:Uncharacterized protein n=1 Tax=Hyphomicrobium denitrificans 1NES1 TaxID=670307 RepID=N0B9Z3_9HYPH|nr:hypothetical protein HYPDE_26238 [Hyphomicrobium denitrificans 1NES1]
MVSGSRRGADVAFQIRHQHSQKPLRQQNSQPRAKEHSDIKVQLGIYCTGGQSRCKPELAKLSDFIAALAMQKRCSLGSDRMPDTKEVVCRHRIPLKDRARDIEAPRARCNSKRTQADMLLLDRSWIFRMRSIKKARVEPRGP